LSRLRGAWHDISGWLWDTIAGPVLEELRIEPAADPAARPRLWWCPTSVLNLLPLHAAGHYREPQRTGRVLQDRVVPSYTPTLSALVRQDRTVAVSPTSPVAFVGVPGSGDAALPAVTRELEKVARHCVVDVLIGPDATRVNALRTCAEHDWVHFACHGGTNILEPGRGLLMLTDGPLTVHELAGLQLGNAGLAFLSACQTALGSTALADEALHLAGAMQMAGFRHVIAALWSISDRHAPTVADALYSRLVSDGRRDPTEAGRALQHSVGTLRETYPDALEIWGPYVHVGP
jgi:CHAT domain